MTEFPVVQGPESSTCMNCKQCQAQCKSARHNARPEFCAAFWQPQYGTMHVMPDAAAHVRHTCMICGDRLVQGQRRHQRSRLLAEGQQVAVGLQHRHRMKGIFHFHTGHHADTCPGHADVVQTHLHCEGLDQGGCNRHTLVAHPKGFSTCSGCHTPSCLLPLPCSFGQGAPAQHQPCN